MPLSKYVSAQWTKPMPPVQPTIKAIGDDGLEYFIPSMDSDVPPWPQYLADGGTVAPADADGELSDQITNAPDDLTGGPTLGEIYNGN
jgi:hypothetical protein